jgi:capsular polysaccharide transport system permease protein
LEAAGSVVVFIIVVCILAVYSTDFSPRDWPGIVFAVAATIYFGFSFAVPNALIAQILAVWYMFFNLSIPVFWLASGIVFFPTAIPAPYDRWLALNPLLQCVEWIRYAYYEDYPDKLLNIPYSSPLRRHVLLSDRRKAREACASFKVIPSSSDHDQCAYCGPDEYDLPGLAAK